MGQIEEQSLVEVFRTEDPALLPLAVATLDQASIEYVVQSTNEGIPIPYGYRPGLGDVAGPAVVVVRAADAARAKSLLGDLESAARTGAALDGRVVEADAGVSAARAIRSTQREPDRCGVGRSCRRNHRRAAAVSGR